MPRVSTPLCLTTRLIRMPPPYPSHPSYPRRRRLLRLHRLGRRPFHRAEGRERAESRAVVFDIQYLRRGEGY